MYMISHTGRPPLAGEFTSELPQSHAITDERPPSRLYAAAQPSSSNRAESSGPVASALAGRFFCVMPTSTVYCASQTYADKADEVRQIEEFLRGQGVERVEMVASSIGADLAMAFLTQTRIPAGHVFFDGGQFAQIGKATRRIMVPMLYLAIKSLYWSKGTTLDKIMWCSDKAIKPYFVAAGKALSYGNIRRQMADSLEDKPFPPLSKELQKRCFFEFGSAEDHFKYRAAVMQAYPAGNFPVFDGYNHMQYQIRDPKGFAAMMELPFLQKE